MVGWHNLKQKLSMKLQLFFIVNLAWSLVYQCEGESQAASSNLLYADITPANTLDSLNRIKAASFSVYEFKHDKIAGRRQLGILGSAATEQFPESVEIIPNYAMPSKERGKAPITLPNFPVVDKNVIFMHGICALQEILKHIDQYDSKISSIHDAFGAYIQKLESMETYLHDKMNETMVEKKNVVEAQLQLDVEAANLELQRVASEREQTEKELRNQKALLDYEQNLATTRMNVEQDMESVKREAILQVERQMLEKREQLRIENSAKLREQKRLGEKELEEKRREYEIEKIRAEIEAQAAKERANEDVVIRKMRAKANFEAQRTVESTKAVMEQFVTIFHRLTSDPLQVVAFLATLLGVYFVYYIFQQVVAILRGAIQSAIGRPSLVRETSSSYVWGLPRMFKETLEAGRQAIESAFHNVVLSSENRQRVVQLALSTRQTKASGAPYRHVLLHGPPGTGKTLIARTLAMCSGMDYAIMSGGDVAPLGDNATDQLNGLFKWAARSPKGLLLFIDEAEAFLSKRGTQAGGSPRARAGASSAQRGTDSGASDASMRHALNALLAQTGTQSTQFMMVLATNRPQDLDEAVLDRIDVSLFIGHPEEEERLVMAKLYMGLHVKTLATDSQKGLWAALGLRTRYTVEEGCHDFALLQKIVDLTEGYSGREISKLFLAVRVAMMLAEDHNLSVQLLLDVVMKKHAQHQQLTRFAGKVGVGMGPYGVKLRPAPIVAPVSIPMPDDSIMKVLPPKEDSEKPLIDRSSSFDVDCIEPEQTTPSNQRALSNKKEKRPGMKIK
jgi:ATPase family AAA domain-containing protein 3A/B